MIMGFGKPPLSFGLSGLENSNLRFDQPLGSNVRITGQVERQFAGICGLIMAGTPADRRIRRVQAACARNFCS